MKSSGQLAVIATAAVLLVVGMFFGLHPISTVVTQVNPELRDLTAPCGIGYLPGVPGTTDPVQLRDNRDVLLPRVAYAEHCTLATSWQPYVAWSLTGVGLLGLAMLFVGRRDRVGVWPGT